MGFGDDLKRSADKLISKGVRDIGIKEARARLAELRAKGKEPPEVVIRIQKDGHTETLTYTPAELDRLP